MKYLQSPFISSMQPWNLFDRYIFAVRKTCYIRIVEQISLLHFFCNRILPEIPDIIEIIHTLISGKKTQGFQDFCRKVSFQIFIRNLCIFYHILEKCRAYTEFVIHLFRNMKWMKNIRCPASICLPMMCFVCHPHSFFRQSCINHNCATSVGSFEPPFCTLYNTV